MLHHSSHTSHHTTTSCVSLLRFRRLIVRAAGDGRQGELTEIVTALAMLRTNDIAHTLGVNPKALRSALRRNGISLRAIRQYNKKENAPEGLGVCRSPLYRGAIRRLWSGGTRHSPRRRLPLAARRSFEAGFRLLRRPEIRPRLLLPPSLSQSFRTGGAPWPLGQETQKKQPRPELAEAPNEHRRQHTPFTRDVLTPPGAPTVARHRTRTLLTPLAVRRAIIEEAADQAGAGSRALACAAA